MRVVIAMDSFKGSLTSLQAGKAACEGVMSAMPGADVVMRPVSDGGEGLVECLVTSLGGSYAEADVTDPLGKRVAARYGIINSGDTAVIEMSSASGLVLVEHNNRNPMYTTSYGTGELILDALDRGMRHFIIGIGGSATNDGGAGMLQALGVKLLTGTGTDISKGAVGLSELKSIDITDMDGRLRESEFRILCDVTNPLCGKQGASKVFGPQKGASPDDAAMMDKWLEDFAFRTQVIIPGADPLFPGTGAAGGMGFAFMSYLSATMERGIDTVIRETRLEKLISKADIVITGEGKIDDQTGMGKLISGVTSIARRHGVRVMAFAGRVECDRGSLAGIGIDECYQISDPDAPVSDVMQPDTAYKNLRDTVYRAFTDIDRQRSM